jgi:hypothetical protein
MKILKRPNRAEKNQLAWKKIPQVNGKMVANDSINLSRRFKIGKVERYECRYVE